MTNDLEAHSWIMVTFSFVIMGKISKIEVQIIEMKVNSWTHSKGILTQSLPSAKLIDRARTYYNLSIDFLVTQIMIQK